MRSFTTICRFILVSGLAATFFSCNNSTEKKEEAQQTADTSTAATAAPAAAFTPFDVVEIAHTVKDYAKWRPAFDLDSTERKASGLEFMIIGRNMDNPNDLLIVLNASDVQKAKDFGASPRLKDVMEKAGVSSRPDVQLFHVIRFDPNANEKQWVLVTHKVKDFDAWLKVFDEEGKAARAAQGLIDVALCRGIDDPNLVHLAFDIRPADLAKAKAAITSEEKKQLMTKAGVEGAPKITFYNSAE